MDIRRLDKYAVHRKVALTAGVFILLIAGVTGAGMLVFSPSAGARPIAAFGQWNPPGQADGNAAGTPTDRPGTPADDAATDTGNDGRGEPSLLAKLFGGLEDDAPTVDTAALAGAALASAADMTSDADEEEERDEGATETTGPADGDDGNVVFQVTEQDLDQAVAVSQEAVGFWGWLWNMLSGAAIAVANTITSAVAAD